MSPPKYLVLSWTADTGTVVGVYHNVADATAVAAAVSLTDGTIGAGYFLLSGSESLVVVAGTNSYGS